MAENFKNDSLGSVVEKELFDEIEMVWDGSNVVTTRATKQLLDEEFTSDTTFRFDYNYEVTIAYYNSAVGKWSIESVVIQGATDVIVAAAALLAASISILSF